MDSREIGRQFGLHLINGFLRACDEHGIRIDASRARAIFNEKMENSGEINDVFLKAVQEALTTVQPLGKALEGSEGSTQDHFKNKNFALQVIDLIVDAAFRYGI